MQVTHCHRWQTAMAVLSFTLATLMIVAGVRQLLHPWDLKHHAFFSGVPLPDSCMAPCSHLKRNALLALMRVQPCSSRNI